MLKWILKIVISLALLGGFGFYLKDELSRTEKVKAQMSVLKKESKRYFELKVMDYWFNQTQTTLAAFFKPHEDQKFVLKVLVQQAHIHLDNLFLIVLDEEEKNYLNNMRSHLKRMEGDLENYETHQKSSESSFFSVRQRIEKSFQTMKKSYFLFREKIYTELDASHHEIKNQTQAGMIPLWIIPAAITLLSVGLVMKV